MFKNIEFDNYSYVSSIKVSKADKELVIMMFMNSVYLQLGRTKSNKNTSSKLAQGMLLHLAKEYANKPELNKDIDIPELINIAEEIKDHYKDKDLKVSIKLGKNKKDDYKIFKRVGMNPKIYYKLMKLKNIGSK